MDDPTVTDPGKYRVIFENERVRVLEFRDRPGIARRPTTTPTASCPRCQASTGA